MSQANPAHVQEDLRQVLVVRHDLKMRKGKIGAQCAHAAMAALFATPGKTIERDEQGQAWLKVPLTEYGHDWLTTRFKKICVYVNSEEELLALRDQVAQAGLQHALIQDAGLTEFGGKPTYTVLGIGPAPKDKLEPFTGKLPLY